MKTTNDAMKSLTTATPLTWALLLSVIANLFLIGFLMSMTHGGHHHGMGPLALASPHGDSLTEWMGRHLDPPDATVFHASMQTQQDALKQAHAHVRQATKDVAAAFQKNPADPAALQVTLDRWNQAKTEMNIVVSTIIQDIGQKLTPEGRRRLAELAE